MGSAHRRGGDPERLRGAVPCSDQGAANGHVRFCGGSDTTVPTWDTATPIDVNVALPPEPTSGPDGPYPLLMIFHGWGGSEMDLSAMKPWAEAGYAVFSMSDRGWGMSCGATDPKRLTPACANGYNHLMDTRLEVRDAQHFAGRLADEGVAIPDMVGATGGSYGGGLSMALAALRNRVMLPTAASPPGRARTGLRWRSRRRSRTSPGPISRIRCCRTGTHSTTSPTRPTSSAIGSAS